MKKALGKGLGALIPKNDSDEVMMVEVERILPNPNQPRKIFADKALNTLAESIGKSGILQPLLVRKAQNDTFYLIAGERRLRASILAGLKKVPCIIRKKPSDGVSNDDNDLVLSLIENIQREDLNPIEMAEAFKSLKVEFQLTQEEIAARVGKERATVANYLRILNLPDSIKQLLADETLSMGHARALLSLEDGVTQEEVAKIVVEKSLSVRQTESFCKNFSSVPREKAVREVDPFINSLEDELTRNLGTRVRILSRGKKGKIEIEYYSTDELNRLVDIFKI